MVTNGNVTQPQRIQYNTESGTGKAQMMVDFGGTESERLKNVYPHSWLMTGQPYEYTLHPTPALPPQLMETFHQDVKNANIDGGKNILGICHIPGDIKLDLDEMFVERTEGRKNIEQRIDVKKEGRPDNGIPTRWLPTLSAPGTPARCLCECILIDDMHVPTGCSNDENKRGLTHEGT